MKEAAQTLQSMIRAFFERHLAVERRASANTIKSYRDGLKLFLSYASAAKGCPAEQLSFDVLNARTVSGFLTWLHRERGCGASTRNQRLAVLKSFARYTAISDPRHLERSRAIRELANASTTRAEPEYLEEEEVQRLITAVRGPSQERDHALLVLLYNTGARVQEIVDLDACDIRDGPIPFVVLRGKGGRQRSCPLWDSTLKTVQRWLATRKDASPDAPLFVNRRGHRITRSGIAYLLSRAAEAAGLRPRHARRVSPHVIRHTTAMHLLQSGVDITTIAAWLGHAQLNTTHGYVQINLRMKHAAVSSDMAPPELSGGTYPTDELLDWLEAIGRHPVMRSRPPPFPANASPRTISCT